MVDKIDEFLRTVSFNASSTIPLFDEFEMGWGCAIGRGESFGGGISSSGCVIGSVEFESTVDTQGVFANREPVMREIFGKRVYRVDGIQCIFKSVHKDWAVVEVDLLGERKTLFLAKLGGFISHGNSIREAFEQLQDKVVALIHYEENKALFMKRFPKMDKKYANSDLIRWHSKVFGACDEGTALFLKEKRIPYFGKTTLVEFFDTIRGGFHSWLVADLENEYKRL